MSSPILVIQESEIASVAENGKAVVVTLDNALEIEIPFEAGQAITLAQPILAGNKYQLVMSGNNGTWIIEDLTEAPLLARKTEIEALVPSASPGGSGATLAEQQAQTLLLEEIKDLITLQSPGLTWTKTVASITTASDDIIVANADRKGLIINNRPGGAIAYYDPSGGTCTTNDLQIASNGYVSFRPDEVPKTNVTGRRASGIGTLTVYEGV